MRHIPSPPPLWISNTLGLAEQNPAVCEHVHELGMGRLSPPEPSAEQTVLCLPKGFREPVAWGRFYFSDLDLSLPQPAKLQPLFYRQVNLHVSLRDLEQK